MPAVTASKVQVFSRTGVESQLAVLVTAATASGSSGTTLGDYRSHAIKLSVRSASGGAEVHAHYDVMFVVTEGKATLVTGGTVVNAKTDSDGEQWAAAFRMEGRRPLSKETSFTFRQACQHPLTIADGNVFGAIVVKVREGP